MANSNYSMSTGSGDEVRLQILNEVYNPYSHAFIDSHFSKKDAVILEIGCGAGLQAIWMAQHIVPDGLVIASDSSDEQLEIARKNAKLKNVSNIRFLNLDISEKVTKEDVKADLITNRFLLLHLKNDKKAIQNMLSLLKPEGYLISQDAIMTGVMAGPESAAFNQFSYYFNEHLRKQNKNPNIGADLFSLYQECGLTDIEMNVVQPVLYTTREKSLMQLSFVAIKESLLRLGLMSESEFEELNKQLISELDNPRQICFPGRLTQITGKYKSH